jgi:hypothetical protein
MVVFALASVEGNAANRIKRVDGTQINGERLSFSNDRYIICSTTLGQIELAESVSGLVIQAEIRDRAVRVVRILISSSGRLSTLRN